MNILATDYDKQPLRKQTTERRLALAQVNFEYPDPSRVLGLSTSQWTKVVDWRQASASGIKFAIIKAKHGLLTADYFKENYKGAKDAGILVGAYLWLCKPHPWLSAGGQGRGFAELLKDYPLDLPAFVDFEWNSNLPSGNPDASELYGCVKPFDDAYEGLIGIYTAPGYWNQYGTKNPLWQSYSLWQAQYNHGLADSLSPWPRYDFLQWTQVGKGVDYGVPKDGEIACELNYWRGTYDELLSFCGKQPAPTAPLPVPPASDYNQAINDGIAALEKLKK